MYKLGYRDIGIFHFLHGLSNKISDKYQKKKKIEQGCGTI